MYYLFLGSGYQTEDIDISDTSTFLCVLGDVVLGPDGIPVRDHKYVFSPEVVQRKVMINLYISAKSKSFLPRLMPSPMLPSW